MNHRHHYRGYYQNLFFERNFLLRIQLRLCFDPRPRLHPRLSPHFYLRHNWAEKLKVLSEFFVNAYLIDFYDMVAYYFFFSLLHLSLFLIKKLHIVSLRLDFLGIKRYLPLNLQGFENFGSTVHLNAEIWLFLIGFCRKNKVTLHCYYKNIDINVYLWFSPFSWFNKNSIILSS